ncbi:MAG: hypothetical protein MZV64_60140 [Ignavibacteriales bacterium]|nr:hypothetical protein [Ignavibacteriales bacterium]
MERNKEAGRPDCHHPVSGGTVLPAVLSPEESDMVAEVLRSEAPRIVEDVSGFGLHRHPLAVQGPRPPDKIGADHPARHEGLSFRRRRPCVRFSAPFFAG